MTARIVAIDDPTLEIVTKALKAEASKLQRAAMRAAGELEVEVDRGEVSDRRPAAVRITKVLAEAAALVTFAERLEAAPYADAETSAEPGLDVPDDAAELAQAAAELIGDAEESAAVALPDGYRSALDEDELDPEEVLR